MVEVDNQLKKHIYITVDNKYLKGEYKVTLGFGNCVTLALIQYIFDTYSRFNLGDK